MAGFKVIDSNPAIAVYLPVIGNPNWMCWGFVRAIPLSPLRFLLTLSTEALFEPSRPSQDHHAARLALKSTLGDFEAGQDSGRPKRRCFGHLKEHLLHLVHCRM